MRRKRSFFRRLRGGAVAHARSALWLLLPAISVLPNGALGQRPFGPDEARWMHATWVDDVHFAASNALVTGLITGFIQAIGEDGSFTDGFAKGALGGTVVYLGKRLAAERFDGAGLLGRQVAAIGSSLAVSGRSGTPFFDEVVLPLGPVRLRWAPRTGSLRVRPDLTTAYWLLYGALSDRLTLSWRESWSAGTPVFLTEGADLRDVNGAVIGSVVFADRASTVPLRDVLAHERVHVIQLDHAWAVWGAPLEGWALSSFGSSLPGWALGVDLAVFPTLVLEVFGRAVDRSSNPFEVEAEFLEIQWYR